MDSFVNSTQQFDVRDDDDNDEATGDGPLSPTPEQNYGAGSEAALDGDTVEFATQAFVPPPETAYDDDDESNEEMQATQAFATPGSPMPATQSFPVNAFDDTPLEDPMLSDQQVVVESSTQQFSVIAEYATVSGNANDSSDFGLPPLAVENEGQNYVDGLGAEVAENTAAFVEEGEEEEEQEEDGEGGSNSPKPGDASTLDEIASPDPPDETEESDGEDQQQLVVAADEKGGSGTTRRLNRISSEDDEGENSDDGAGTSAGKLIREDGNREDEADDDDEEEEKKSEVGELIANIFGDSDDEDRASDAEDGKNDQPSEHSAAAASGSDRKDDSDDELRPKMVVTSDFVSDFDLMMERRRAENSRRYRKRKDYDVVNDSDDMINEVIGKMKEAAKADNELNKGQKPALTKRKLLSTVIRHLKKSDLRSAFIELGVVNAIADWLYPLPDGSLPALEIRTELLKVLQEFPTLDHQILKSSQIGKAVMVLYKHPKEMKENKERAGKLINEWARPIFNLQSDYRSLTKEDRLQLDYDHMPLAKKRRMSNIDAENKAKPDAEAEEERPLRPGEKGWIGRARVPQPSTKDYVVRPRWNIEAEIRQTSGKKSSSVLDRKIREIKERTKAKKTLRAVGVSIEGRKM